MDWATLRKKKKKIPILPAIFLLFLTGLILSAFLKWDWIVTQYNKIPGMYHIAKGDKKLKEEKFFEAIEHYKTGLLLFPNHSQAWCNLGNIYVTYENYTEAAEKYREGLKHTNKDFVCRINLGIILSEKLLEHDEAIIQYQKVIDSPVPAFTIPYFTRDKKTALANQGLAYYNMGMTYKHKALLDSENSSLFAENLYNAADKLEKASEILKTDYDVFYNLALTHQQLNNNSEAKQAYCKAIELEPLKYEAHYNLAVLLKKEKDYKAALDEFEKVSLILEYYKNPAISRYVFELLNEVRGKIILIPHGSLYLAERFESKFIEENQITYKKGKLKIPDEFDEKMINNFKICSINDIIDKNKTTKNDKQK